MSDGEGATFRPLIASIITAASALWDVHERDIKGPTRFRFVIEPRFAICLVGREHGYSLRHIGHMLGGRDHTSVVHGIARAEDLARRDPNYQRMVCLLRDAAVSPGRIIRFIEPAPIKPPKTRHVKSITLEQDEVKDAGHEFHDGIAAGSALLVAAINRARLELGLAA